MMSPQPDQHLNPTHAEFLNRDLSWLEFNRRVLHEALDPRTPLLERVFFLSIFDTNLDEFFQRRVGGLKRLALAGLTTRTYDGSSIPKTLQAIRTTVMGMTNQQATCYTQQVRPALAKAGIHLLDYAQLTEQEVQFTHQYFRTNLFAVLTPLAVDTGHPFPFISNLSMSLGVMIDPGQTEPTKPSAEPEQPDQNNPSATSTPLQFARVKVPPILPRWVRVNPPSTGEPLRFVHIAQIIRHNLADLFEGAQLRHIEAFRLTRNVDIERDEEDAEDLIALVEKELRDRRFGRAVRLEVAHNANSIIVDFLKQELGLQDQDIYALASELDYSDLYRIAKIPRADLRHPAWSPIIPPKLADQEANIFEVIRSGDILVHHPYESFSASVERFIQTAACDPKVVAIKQTLYRTSTDSPFIPDLIRAAESGKQVVCLVELKARFDERHNISVAQRLEKAGVHVVYGMVGLKTHAKTAIVVRQEADAMRVYAHIGTGNYNPITAQTYCDLSLFTCHSGITHELTELFHSLTGRSVTRSFSHLLIAPINMRQRFMELIQREIDHTPAWRARGGDLNDPDRPKIIAKMNSLEDQAVVRKLYEASGHGVKIQLIVRGFCCLRPGVQGLSEHISVISVIGRFLEHSRIYYFHNQRHGEYLIGSADWMYRNLNNRVECVTPIYDTTLQSRIDQILQTMLHDQRQAWEMQPDGQYIQRQPAPHATGPQGTHAQLMHLARQVTKLTASNTND